MHIKYDTLVIDDDEVFSKTLCRALNRHELTSDFALNQQQALEKTQKYIYSYVVLDLRLEQDSGLNLIKPLLAINPKIKIVVLTGFASISTAVQAIKFGAIDYLPKPADSSSIVKAFNKNHVSEKIEFDPTPLKQLEWEHIQRVLKENDGNVSITAKQLNMHRRTLQRKLRKRPNLNKFNLYS